MYKLRVVIADTDSRYIDAMVSYVQDAVPHFKIVAFTQSDLLYQYFRTCNEKIDILLVHSDFLADFDHVEKLTSNQVGLIVLFSDGRIPKIDYPYHLVNKYQPGEKIINQLIELYAQNNSEAVRAIAGDLATRVVCVYAPAGGVGKTSVALGLAAKMADEGNKVFCLSLERISSIIAALPSSGTDALTRALLSLQDIDHQFTVNLDGYKTHDNFLGIDFFEPSECFSELEEVSSGVWKKLVQGLKEIGKYDFIIVDTDSVADDKTLALLKMSDQIIFVQVDEVISVYKTRIFLEQIHHSGVNARTNLLEKAIFLLNKVQETSDSQSHIEFLKYGLPVHFSIPFFSQIWLPTTEDGRFQINRVFANQFEPLIKQLKG